MARLLFVEAKYAHVVLRMQRHQTRRPLPSNLRREPHPDTEAPPRCVWREGEHVIHWKLHKPAPQAHVKVERRARRRHVTLHMS